MFILDFGQFIADLICSDKISNNLVNHYKEITLNCL